MRQWDTATGEELKQLVLKHPNYVSALDLSSDGTLAITSCDDGTARVWRLADAQMTQSLPSTGKPFNAVSFAPDGRSAVLTSSTDRQVKLWNLAPRCQPGCATARNPPCWQNDQRYRRCWILRNTPRLQEARRRGLVGHVRATMASMCSRSAATTPSSGALEPLRPTVRFSPHGAVASAALSPDGRLLATGSWDQSAKIWDAATGHAIRKLDGGHSGYINTVEFSPDGGEVLTASDDGTARFWNVASGKPTE